MEWVNYFTKAVTFSSGHSLKTLFKTLLVHEHVSDPIKLLKQYGNNICNDLPHWLRFINRVPDDLMDPHLDYGHYLLNEILADMGKSLRDY